MYQAAQGEFEAQDSASSSTYVSMLPPIPCCSHFWNTEHVRQTKHSYPSLIHGFAMLWIEFDDNTVPAHLFGPCSSAFGPCSCAFRLQSIV